MKEYITLKIDGKTVKTEKGSTVRLKPRERRELTFRLSATTSG